MLACDVFYPQFFKVLDDPEFDSNPIIPSEELLRELIDHHATVKGVSSADPSLYCATHIYTASMDQVLQVLSAENDMALPFSFIPKIKS